MDRWILASAQDLIQFVKAEMAAYRLYTVVPRLLSFVEALTNWYVRMNRRRFKGELGAEEAHTSLQVLFDVVLSLCLVMAPFTPFLTEHMWQVIRKWSNA
jgi:isoleucyl-tRNA synthetase